MTKKIRDFAFNGAGTVTLQITTLALLLTMSWKVSEWKTELEAKLDDIGAHGWTSIQMAEWSNLLAINNEELEVPDTWDVIDKID